MHTTLRARPYLIDPRVSHLHTHSNQSGRIGHRFGSGKIVWIEARIVGQLGRQPVPVLVPRKRETAIFGHRSKSNVEKKNPKSQTIDQLSRCRWNRRAEQRKKLLETKKRRADRARSFPYALFSGIPYGGFDDCGVCVSARECVRIETVDGVSERAYYTDPTLARQWMPVSIQVNTHSNWHNYIVVLRPQSECAVLYIHHTQPSEPATRKSINYARRTLSQSHMWFTSGLRIFLEKNQAKKRRNMLKQKSDS